MDFKVEEEKAGTGRACLKVIGVGGGGGNAVNSMAASQEMDMVEFMIANTDAQALEASEVSLKIQLGEKITKGLGAGSNPDVGRRSAEEDLEAICDYIKGADILYVTAGMGGGTGSGALPVIANAAKEMGILTVGIVTKPFAIEGKRRMRHAEDAIKNLKQSVDTLLVVPNQKLLETVDPKISMLDAFALSNDVLKQAIKGISDIIVKPGHINVDFADVRSIMKDMGLALMGMGRMQGEGRAREAALSAINSPLLEDVSIEGARGVLINITGNTDLGLHEINEAAEVVYDLVSEDANIILGSVIDSDMGDELMVTVIATGFEHGLDKDKGYSTFGQAPYSAPQQAPSFVAQQPQYAAPAPVTPQQVAPTTAAPASVAPAQAPQPVQAAPAPAAPVNEAPASTAPAAPSDAAFNMQDLDTPAFLRKRSAGKDDESRAE